MNFKVDLSEVSSGIETVYSPEQKVKFKANYLMIKKKVDAGGEMTLEDQKIVIQHARADREEKFVLAKAKIKKPTSPKIRKPKKLSRANLLLLILKQDIEELTEDEIKDKDHSIALYKGRKISGKALNILLVAEARGDKLNALDEMDKNLGLYGDVKDG